MASSNEDMTGGDCEDEQGRVASILMIEEYLVFPSFKVKERDEGELNERKKGRLGAHVVWVRAKTWGEHSLPGLTARLRPNTANKRVTLNQQQRRLAEEEPMWTFLNGEESCQRKSTAKGRGSARNTN